MACRVGKRRIIAAFHLSSQVGYLSAHGRLEPSELNSSGRRDRTSIPCLTGRSITVIRCRIKKSGRRDLDPRSRAPDDHRCATVPAWARCGVPNCQGTRAPDQAALGARSRTHVAADHRCAAVPGVRGLGHRPSLRDGARTSAFHSVGPDGLEPSLGGLRVRCAAANTLVPCLDTFPIGAEGIEPSTGSL
jgi:hypothetical protein